MEESLSNLLNFYKSYVVLRHHASHRLSMDFSALSPSVQQIGGLAPLGERNDVRAVEAEHGTG